MVNSEIPFMGRINEALKGGSQFPIASEGLKWIDLILAKNADYGDAAWRRPLLSPALPPRTAILVRMSDKINRLVSLIEKGVVQVKEETIDDTIRDLGVYCLLYLTCPSEE